jgi:hypothetical protein
MVVKHEFSKNKHRNKCNNIELSCEHGMSGWSNEQRPGHLLDRGNIQQKDQDILSEVTS